MHYKFDTIVWFYFIRHILGNTLLVFIKKMFLNGMKRMFEKCFIY